MEPGKLPIISCGKFFNFLQKFNITSIDVFHILCHHLLKAKPLMTVINYLSVTLKTPAVYQSLIASDN